jgi:serine/threonine protein kinase
LRYKEDIGVVHQSADVWSLAMVISEILSGEIPFDSAPFRQMELNAFNTAISEGHRPKIPPRLMNITWLSGIIQRAWAYEPLERCTAKELLEVFEQQVKY